MFKVPRVGFFFRFFVFEKEDPLLTVTEVENENIAYLEVYEEAFVVTDEFQALFMHRSLPFKHIVGVRHFHFLLK